MASRLKVALERLLVDRPKPNTVNPTLTNSRRYGKGGKLKSTNKKKSI